MHNMIVEYRRDDYESGLCDILLLDDTEVTSVSTADIQCNHEQTMPRIVNGQVMSWAQRIWNREQEITNSLEHHRLRLDLIEHLWRRAGLTGRQ